VPDVVVPGSGGGGEDDGELVKRLDHIEARLAGRQNNEMVAEPFRRRGDSDPAPTGQLRMDRNVRGFSDACT
jgi:hypothetical protein